MKLPAEFSRNMRKLMGEAEYEQLITALSGERVYGLRINTLKIDIDEFRRLSPFDLEAVPWAADGFYISGEDAPGRHPYYHAGLYYIQEPSAMLPGQVLGAEPGDRVLDLCAAPGGKTVQIAAAMKGRGLLVSNDINAERVKALVKNIELCGIRNAVVLNESPERLVRNFEGYFDKILIDAPCSGEGMFRKDETAVRSWESFKCERCTRMQESILHYADLMLRPGGTLVYSTCTFSPEENEQMIMDFVMGHKGYEFVNIPKIAGIEGGRPEWAQSSGEWAGGTINPEDLRQTARLWPHKVRGEGHFVAKLIKGRTSETRPGDRVEGTVRYEKLPADFHRFIDENMNHIPEGVFMLKGRHLYHLPEAPPQMAGLKVVKFGWFLGSVGDKRFEPSHSLVTALDKDAFKRAQDFSAESAEVRSYLKGETLLVKGDKGFTVVCVDGKTLGWAKQTGEMLKNMYPKGWRMMR
ncbi:MAG TPA: RsmB/NOP family class I SAM-dependent RNA methyltransferase [Clostridiales bacterium]|nr:RsmB/NOP family class I SAM-dependent RNA methyltransferase [Clostridiales bacterium]